MCIYKNMPLPTYDTAVSDSQSTLTAPNPIYAMGFKIQKKIHHIPKFKKQRTSLS